MEQLKQWTPIKIEWLDPERSDGWQSIDEIKHQIIPVVTLGFLYRQDENLVTIVSSKTDEEAMAVLTIPTCIIKNIEEIKI